MSNRPNQADSLMTGDQFVIFRGNCTNYVVMPQDALLNWILENIPTSTGQTSPVVQYYNPTGNFTLNVENYPEGTYLLLNPTIGITNGTLVLPSNADIVDQQQIHFICSQQIPNFSINGNGANVVGAPSAISATAFFKLQYDKLSGTWYRVG